MSTAKRKGAGSAGGQGVQAGAMGILYTILRFITRHIRGFWSALAAVLTLAALVGVLAIGVLALLAKVVMEGVTQGFDENVLRGLEASRSPLFNEIMLEISTIGSGVPLILMVFVAALLLWLTRHRWSAGLLVVGSLGGTIINRVLKMSFDRERPSVVEAVEVVRSLYFPSGHATSSFIVYGTLAYILTQISKQHSVRMAIWIIAAGMIVLVGFSRMYLGVHYPTDVAGGFLVGLAWVMIVASVMNAIRFLSSRRPETRAEEQDLDEPGTPHAAR
jgi:undecaprenyl-diphosphatase